MKRIASLAIAGLLVVSAVPMSIAEDRASLAQSLAKSTDVHVRVSAALALGKSGDHAARGALERALQDSKPAVRAAAATGLGSLGDGAAIPSLKAAEDRESAGDVKTKIHEALTRLGSSGATKSTGAKAKFLLKMGRVDDRSGANLEIMPHFQRTARFHLGQIPSGELLDEDADPGAEEKARHLPVFALDGALTKLDKVATAREVTFSARVEFLIRRVPDQAIKGTVAGSASALADARSVQSERELAQLRRDAVTAAIESAVKGASPALEAAAH